MEAGFEVVVVGGAGAGSEDLPVASIPRSSNRASSSSFVGLAPFGGIVQLDAMVKLLCLSYVSGTVVEAVGSSE